MRRSSLAGVALALFCAAACSRSARANPMSTSPEQAYDMGTIPAARAVGMGGALNALGTSTPALYLNPANLPLARVYHLEALGAYSPDAQRQTYGLAIVDSVLNSSHISGGIGGTWNEIEPDGLHRVWTDVRAALAAPLGDYVSVGVAGRYLKVDQRTSAGPFGPSYASDGTPNGAVFNQLTFDAGLTASLGQAFRIGLVGHNLTNPGTSLAPTTGALGLGYTSQVFSLETDGMLDFTTYGHTTGRVMAGGELFLANRYAVRAGWHYDTGDALHTASIGLGYVDPHYSIELGAQRDLIGDHGMTLGVLSLKYFYDALGTTTPADLPDEI